MSNIFIFGLWLLFLLLLPLGALIYVITRPRKPSAPAPPEYLYKIEWRTWRAEQAHNYTSQQLHETYFRELSSGEYEFLINSPAGSRSVHMTEGSRIEVIPHVFDCGEWVNRGGQFQRIDKVIQGGAMIVHQPNGSIDIVCLYQLPNGTINAQNAASVIRQAIEERAAKKPRPVQPAAKVANAPRAAGFDL